MKNRLSNTSFFERLRCRCNRLYQDCVARKNDFVAARACVRRQHQVLLALGIFFLLCWIIASFWLINAQKKEPHYEVAQENPATISMISPAEMAVSRIDGPGDFVRSDRSVVGGI